MIIRDLRSSDIPILQRWYRESGFDYPFPDLASPDFARVSVICDEHDQPVMALPAKRTIEMYLLCDKNWGTPRQRLMALQLGHEEMRLWLVAHGWSDVNCWLPPAIEQAFAKRLQHIFGWVKSRWNSYSRLTAGDR